jgi:hypothetical protein
MICKWLKKKKYKYKESPAIKDCTSGSCEVDGTPNLKLTGNKFENESNIVIEGQTFDGGELQIFFDNCTKVTIKDCHFKNVKSDNGHAILGYRTTEVKILNCTFHDMQVGNSEVVAINTGCKHWVVENCTFMNVDNIALDVIAGERDSEYTGHVEVLACDFINCGYRNDYWTAALYVDGASNIDFFNNNIDSNFNSKSLGIEIGAENDRVATNILVDSNTISNNVLYPIIYGSYKKSMAGVEVVHLFSNKFINCTRGYKEQYNARRVRIEE